MNRFFTFNQGRSRAILAGICSVIFAASLSAQVTSVKLPKADSSASFQVKDSGSVVKMRVNGDGGFYCGGTNAVGTIPAQGTGARLMWYPAKLAFRAGHADAQWDDANIGRSSIGMGYNNLASGDNALSMGYYTVASGMFSIAIGGEYDAAIGPYSTVIGSDDTASGMSSTAIGNGNKASGVSSTAIGICCLASGLLSTAMGYHDTASGNYSTAMGSFVSTAGYAGSFIIGDSSMVPTWYSTAATAANQMTMRFAGGYRLLTNAYSPIGVSLTAGGNAWATISDSTKKTNFQKADGDYFLQSLSKLRLGSWNYKAQDAKAYRHYGPMAQEIFHYFGHDAKGTIGCDTLLASADMDGIMMICLQALEKRTGELQKANEKIAVLQTSYDGLKAEMQQMKNDIALLAQAKNSTTSGIALNASKGQ